MYQKQAERLKSREIKKMYILLKVVRMGLKVVVRTWELHLMVKMLVLRILLVKMLIEAKEEGLIELRY